MKQPWHRCPRNSEIAEALNLSIKAVEKRMKQALDYVKKAISES